MKYKITTTAAAKLLQSVRLFATLSTVAHQALMSMGLSRKEYWSGLPWRNTVMWRDVCRKFLGSIREGEMNEI